MIFFQQIETPEFCYAAEAALWLALRRVPPNWQEEIYDPETGSSQFVDYRRGEEALLRGKCENYASAFDEEEFRDAGLEVDYDSYLDAIEKIQGLGADGARDRLPTDPAPSFEDIEDIEDSRLDAGITADHASAARLVGDLEAGFDGMIDEARSKLFLALAGGELEAEGWKPVTHDPNNPMGGTDPDPRGAFQPIPKARWTLRGFDWDRSVLSSGREMFSAVQLRFDDVLKRFPESSARAQEMNGRMFGGTLVIDTAASHGRALRTPRGRPPTLSPETRQAVRNYFSHQIKQRLAPKKREALTSEVIDFVKITFGKQISRTTAQEYIKGLTDNPP